MIRFQRALLLLIVVLAQGTAFAQSHPQVQHGFAPEKLYQFGDLDHINLFSGNMVLTLPIGLSYPLSSNLSYRLTLVYNSKAWEEEQYVPDGNQVSVYTLPHRSSNAGLGWRLSLGRLIPAITSPYPKPLEYEGADSNKHPFYASSYGNEPSGFLYTRDGSFLRLDERTPAVRKVEFPNGEVHEFDDIYRLKRIYNRTTGDPSSSPTTYVNFTYPDPLTITMTDNLGRVQTIALESWGDSTVQDNYEQVVKSVTLKGVNGAPELYTFHYLPSYASEPIQAGACGHPQHVLFPPSYMVPLLQKLTLPDTSEFQFTYWSTPMPDCISGALKTLTLPTLGQLEWDYTGYGGNTATCSGDEVYNVTSGVSRRTLRESNGVESVTTYTPEVTIRPPATWICPGTGTTQDPRPEQEMQNVVVSPSRGNQSTDRRTKTVNYFSIWNRDYANGNDEGFEKSEYGLPLSRNYELNNRFLSSKTYDCDADVLNCVEVRSKYVAYENSGFSGNALSGANTRLAQEETFYGYEASYGGDPGISAWTTYSDYDGFGHYRISRSGGFGSGLERETFTSYNPARSTDPPPIGVPALEVKGEITCPTGATAPCHKIAAPANWIANTYDEQIVTQRFYGITEPGDVAKSELCFDAGTGVLKRQRTLAKATRDDNDLLAVFTHDGDLNVIREEYFGGDQQTLTTSESLCTMTLPAHTASSFRIDHSYDKGVRKSSQYFNAYGQPLSFKVLDIDIDPSTGLPVQSRDSAGIATSFGYTTMGRLASVSPTGAARTEYTYNLAYAVSPPVLASVSIKQPKPGFVWPPLLWTHSEIQFDSLGRIVEERRLTSAGWVTRQTQYNPMGWKNQVSEQEAVPTHFTNFTNYDPFGRARTIQAPDGKLTTMSFAGDRQTTRVVQIGTNGSSPPAVLETAVSTTETYDRFGRLAEVNEAGGASVAQYSYDVGNRLKSVIFPGNTGQTRSFIYDNRGFLLKESHPESLPTTYTYDAKGHVITRRQGPSTDPAVSNCVIDPLYGLDNSIHDLNYEYDSAERLVKVYSLNHYDCSTYRISKQFDFATVNTTNNYKNGKLEKAVRHNYGPSLGDLQVTETFTYGDSAGRITRKDTEIKLPDDQINQIVTQEFAYNELGLPIRSSYPKCIGPDAGCGVAGFTDVGLDYTQGQLSKVYSGNYSSDWSGLTDFASSLTYHPNGLLNTLQYGNAIVATQAIDPSGMARPQSITHAGYEDCTRPTINNHPGNVQISSGQTANLSVSVSGSPTITYQWYRGETGDKDNPVTGATASTFTTPVLTTTTKYWVHVASTCGKPVLAGQPPSAYAAAMMSDTATVSVGSCTAPTISLQPLGQIISSGQSVTLSVEASGSGTLAFQWYQGMSGVTTTPVGTNSQTFTTPALTTTTNYWVRVSNSCGTPANSVTATLTVPLGTPGGFTATRTSATDITTSWTAVTGADHYELERKSGATGFMKIQDVTATSFVDGGRTANTTYVYRVRAVDSAGGSESPLSSHNLATMMTFSGITAGVTVIDDAHFNQLLNAVNYVRGANGWSAVTWASILPAGVPAPAAGQLIYASHITSLRAKMDEALQALGIVSASYTDPILSNAIAVKKVHFDQIRSRAQ